MFRSLQRAPDRSVRSTAVDAILTFGEDGCIEAANPAAEGLLLYAPNELLGRRIMSLIPREFEAAFLTAMNMDTTELGAMELGHPRLFRLMRKDGHSVAVHARIAPVVFEKRRLWTLLAQDNTSHDRAATQWEHMERLAAVGQAASEIAHESRNPLQRIAAAVHQLRKASIDSSKVLNCIARIESALGDLQCLHEAVLEFVKPRVLQPALNDLRDVVRAAWAAATARPGEAESVMHERGATDIDAHCEVDAFAVRQVFRNVFENAISARPSGCEVTVTYENVDRYGEHSLRVVIQDNGPGLSDEARQMIFEPFYTTREHGLGLGMTVAKQIVEAHGGKIFVGEGPGTGIVTMFHKVLA